MNTTNKFTWYVGLTTKSGVFLNDQTSNLRILTGLFESFGINNFSIVKQLGIWEGETEESLQIIHISSDLGEIKAAEIAKQLTFYFDQNAVYLTKELILAQLIEY